MCKIKWMVGLLIVVLSLGAVGVAGAAPTAARGRGALQGKVKAIDTVDGMTFTLETARGDVTVSVDEQARFRAPGSEASSLADVQVGDRVGVRGVWESRDALRAQDVLLIPPGAFRVQGTVIAMRADSLTLSTSKGEVKLQVDHRTRFFVPGVKRPTLGDVTLGTRVIVAGLRDKGAADANDLARGIKVIPTRSRLLVRGKVTAIMSDGFRLLLLIGIV